MAKAFIALGLEPRKSVCILGFNSPEWFISSLAAIFSNAISCGIYTTNSLDMTQFMLNHSQANVVVVEDENQLKKVLGAPDNGCLKAIIQYGGSRPVQEGILSWEDLMKLGENEPDDRLDDRLDQVSINQCCHLVYTSGTTGNPKAAMLSHDNLTFTAKTVCNVYHLKDNEVNVSYLPLSHIAAIMMDLYVILQCQGTTYFADQNALKGTLTATLKEALPTIFFGVPRVYEKIQENLMQLVGTAGKPIEMIKAILGFNTCKCFLVAAAPMSMGTFNFFLALDVRIYEIYGMSECSGPHTYNVQGSHQVGSIGKSVAGYATKIASLSDEGCTPGEILVKGRNVMMGYLADEIQTRGAISSTGWLRSGDLGEVSQDGFFKITGRAKEILITSGGENVAPVPIEKLVKQSLPCVSNAILVGDRQKFISVLLTLKSEVDPDTQEPLAKLAPATLEWCKSIKSKAEVIQDILDHPEDVVTQAIQDGIDTVNEKAASNAQTIKKWKILEKDLSLVGGELGPTLKVKRHFISAKYAHVIESMYHS